MRPRVVHLLDDFALGGVTRSLAIFNAPAVQAVADCRVQPIAPDALIGPRLDADVIILHVPPNWQRLALLASLRRRNPQARIIHVEHSYTGAWEALKVRSTGRFRLMLKLAFRLVNHVVCVSQGQASWLQGVTGLAADRISVIHPHSDNPGLAAVAPPQPGDRLRIGTYGRFCEQKGIDDLIRAMQAGALPHCDLVIGGFGDLEPLYQRLAAGNPHIRFAGKISNVAGFLAGVDVVALPSRWEAYGQVANEAREAGRPILVAPVDGLPEQVGDAGMVVDFNNHAGLALAIARLTPARITAMGTAGRAATQGCGAARAAQWAALISRLAVRG
jgi:glycosyltransferase involved in cell wall biosynthesis